MYCHQYAAETLEHYIGRAANELMAHAKSGNKRRLENTLILSSDLQSDSLFYSFAAGSRPIRFLSSWQPQLFQRVNKVISPPSRLAAITQMI